MQTQTKELCAILIAIVCSLAVAAFVGVLFTEAWKQHSAFLVLVLGFYLTVSVGCLVGLLYSMFDEIL